MDISDLGMEIDFLSTGALQLYVRTAGVLSPSESVINLSALTSHPLWAAGWT
jgi:hypothetical protein